MSQPHPIATGEVTSVGDGRREIRGDLTEEAAPELYLERWGRISQAQMEGKIIQREMTFLCKARGSA